LTNIWKENILKDLEKGELEFLTIGDFLTKLKKEFSSGDDELAKIVELKKVKQRNKTMEKFV